MADSDGLTAEQWFSDEALRKQAEAAAWPEGKPMPLAMMCGIWEPRTKPTEAETCRCGADARDGAGGEEIGRKRWCYLCISRGRHE